MGLLQHASASAAAHCGMSPIQQTVASAAAGLGLNEHAAASHNSDDTVNNESTVHHGTVRADASMLAQCPVGPVTVAPDQATSDSCSSHFEGAAMEVEDCDLELQGGPPCQSPLGVGQMGHHPFPGSGLQQAGEHAVEDQGALSGPCFQPGVCSDSFSDRDTRGALAPALKAPRAP